MQRHIDVVMTPVRRHVPVRQAIASPEARPAHPHASCRTKRHRKVLFCFQFYLPLYSQLVAVFIYKNAFNCKQSDICLEKIAQEILRSFLAMVEYIVNA